MKKILLKIIVCVLLFSCSDEIPDNCNQTNTVEIKYDIQDNVIFLDNVWKQNIDIYTLIPINWIGIDAVNYENYIKIISTKKIKKVETTLDPTQNPFVEFVRLYKNNPVRFVQEVLGVTPDPWQAEFLMHIAKGNRRISVRSGHGVGKSTAGAWAMLWYLHLRFPVKIVVTAPTSSQLYDALFAELKRWIKAMPQLLQDQLEVKQDRIEVKDAATEAFISARTSRAEQPEALQGVHSDNVMLVGDEASGIPEQVFEAAGGSMSGHNAVTLLLGNPVRSSGFFYDTHNRLADDWVTMKVACADSPQVSEAYIEEMKARYGEESNAYRIRVLGEFPRSDDDTVIPMELLEMASGMLRPASTPGWSGAWTLPGLALTSQPCARDRATLLLNPSGHGKTWT